VAHCVGLCSRCSFWMQKLTMGCGGMECRNHAPIVTLSGLHGTLKEYASTSIIIHLDHHISQGNLRILFDDQHTISRHFKTCSVPQPERPASHVFSSPKHQLINAVEGAKGVWESMCCAPSISRELCGGLQSSSSAIFCLRFLLSKWPYSLCRRSSSFCIRRAS